MKLSKNGPSVSHLFFTDDVLLFTKDKSSQARLFYNILENFGKVYGLKINLAKSRAFYSLGALRVKIKKLTTISSIHCTTSLEKYLGFPILKGREASKENFLFIVEKMQSRLAS